MSEPKPRKPRADLEFQHQAALFTWARLPTTKARYPGIEWLHSSLNGVKLTPSQAKKAKAAGMLAGVVDLCLPVPRGVHHGLWVEMKAGSNKPTTEQRTFLKSMNEYGYATAVCWTWEDAREVLVSYLTGALFAS